MSSSMLEQAVIDAEALKEAAVKNAEQTILEKYSTEIKDAVSTLLEQDEDLFGDEEELGLGGDEAEDREDVVDQLDMAATEGEKVCPCPEEGDTIELDLDQLIAAAEGEEEEMDLGMENEPAETEEELFEILDDEVLAEVGKADKDYDGDGEVESKDAEWKGSRDKAIKQSKEEKKEGEGETQKGDFDKTKPGKAGYEKGKVGDKIVEDTEGEETYHYGEDEGEDAERMRRLKRKKQTRDVRGHEKALGYSMEYDQDRERRREKGTHFRESQELDLTDEQLEEILEALTVDIKNVPSGMMFHTHPTGGESKRGLDVALALEQDTVFAEEQEELRKAIKKLEEQVKSQKLLLNKQKKDYNNLKSIALKATKKLEEINFSNAKLIYTNRILKSDSLNERQKDKLVEAVSKVGSVEEAKIVFDTLKENLSSKKSTAPKTLNEAMNKNNPLILKSNTEKQPVNTSQVDRLKRLAGII